MVDYAAPVTRDKTVRVFILDDHELVRRGLAELLTTTDDLIIVGEAATAGDALRRIPAVAPRRRAPRCPTPGRQRHRCLPGDPLHI